MADDKDKDKLIRDLGREVTELSYQLLEERRASYEEHGRLRTLLTCLYERVVDRDAKVQVSKILREMSDDLSGRDSACDPIDASDKAPTHDGKRAIH